MRPDDDPENRIADLERALSTSSATADAPPVRAGSAMRLGWAVLGLLIVGLVVSGVMLAFDGNRPIAGRPAAEDVIGGGGTITAPSPVKPAPSVPPKPPGAPSRIPAPVPGQPISVNGVRTQQTIACRDGAVTVSGVENTIVLTGRCTRVDVSGIKNQVTIEEASVIEVSGLNNVVRFRSGTPELRKSGIDNTLERG